jgi:hypothetical protein
LMREREEGIDAKVEQDLRQAGIPNELMAKMWLLVRGAAQELGSARYRSSPRVRASEAWRRAYGVVIHWMNQNHLELSLGAVAGMCSLKRSARWAYRGRFEMMVPEASV